MRSGRNDSPSACHLTPCGHSQDLTAGPLDPLGSGELVETAEAASTWIALACWLSLAPSRVNVAAPGKVLPAVLLDGARRRLLRLSTER